VEGESAGASAEPSMGRLQPTITLDRSNGYGDGWRGGDLRMRRGRWEYCARLEQ
jgi:hypothetical protein